jgi:uncharacterized protein YcfJ
MMKLALATACLPLAPRRRPPSLRRGMAIVLACSSLGFGTVSAENIVQQAPHVRSEYAQVLKVEPIYQTLRAYATEEQCDPPSARDEQAGRRPKCRVVRVPREFRRAIAYDVDYLHRGMKYRSRLPFDPGKRLLVKVTVAPVIEAEQAGR